MRHFVELEQNWKVKSSLQKQNYQQLQALLLRNMNKFVIINKWKVKGYCCESEWWLEITLTVPLMCFFVRSNILVPEPVFSIILTLYILLTTFAGNLRDYVDMYSKIKDCVDIYSKIKDCVDMYSKIKDCVDIYSKI